MKTFVTFVNASATKSGLADPFARGLQPLSNLLSALGCRHEFLKAVQTGLCHVSACSHGSQHGAAEWDDLATPGRHCVDHVDSRLTDPLEELAAMECVAKR
ncbi:hypothetical protein [Verminephrobacter eiseniae]|uniref:hypothetical protein n=1 Tax=Verminephrobacter eiseniae TaxID=364317 RepID=UPI002237D08B|nr:hypothetical protein [Verminephrobacter eiseniae]